MKVHRTVCTCTCMCLLLTTDTVGLEGYRLTVNRTPPIISDPDDEDEDCKLHPPMIYDNIDQVYMHLHMQCTTFSSIVSFHACKCIRPARGLTPLMLAIAI